MYDDERYFQIGKSKPSYSQFFAQLDISSWVGTETLNSVNFTAKNKETGSDESSTILDVIKCTYTVGNILKPYIRAGVHNQEYRIKIKVVTAEESQEVFYIDFDVFDG